MLNLKNKVIEVSTHFYNNQWQIDMATKLYAADDDVYSEALGYPDTPHTSETMP